MKKFLIGFLLISSVASHASLNCNVKTAKDGKVLSENALREDDGHMNFNQLLDNFSDEDNNVAHISILMVGRVKVENESKIYEAAIYKLKFKDADNRENLKLTQVTQIKSGQEVILAYENYLTTIRCENDNSFEVIN